MIFTANDYATLKALTFRDDYPGYRPADGAVVEAPNGDGVLDTGKSYAHVAAKYTDNLPYNGAGRSTLARYAIKAWRRAMEVAREFSPLLATGVMAPSPDHGALRILHYPAGTGSALHTDFDLFTINCYRNVSNPGLPEVEVHMGELGELLGLGTATPHRVDPLPVAQEAIVYFAVPSHDAVLPAGGTVGEWINERIARSRYSV
jgi:hypothetical protein